MRSAVLSIAALFAIHLLFSDLVAARQPQVSGATPQDQTAVRPWPSAKALAERKKDAQNRRLFQSSDVLPFTLAADFKAIDRDRDPASAKTYPATITFQQPDGTTASRSIQIRGRGHSRRNKQTCDFVPLRLEFPKDSMKGTVFAGHSALKLGTHCRSSAIFEQYVLRELTAYRIFNLITPHSFRVRLARATYVDAATQKPHATRNAMFIEDDDDVARRMEGRITDRPKLLFKHVDLEYTTTMLLFQFLIGNTDLSIFALHNVRVVETPAGKLYPVPYDLDYAGLVNTTYATVDAILGIESVRERLYRGPCHEAADLEPYFARLRALKADMLALYDREPQFTEASRQEAKAYLQEFFKLIDRPNDVKRTFVDVCVRGGPKRQVGM